MADKPEFLRGGGEMGFLTRSFNWSKTALGAPDQWPQSLRTAVSLVLRCPFPMVLFWGKDLIQFYNDAFRPSLGNEGKHPSSLGDKGANVWKEVWHMVGPMIENIMAGGDAVVGEDQLIPIYRDGKIQDVYWTFSYSPVCDESGETGGVVVHCIERTKVNETIKSLEESQHRLLASFEQSPVAIAIINKEQLTFEIANQLYAELVGRKRQDILQKPLLEALPELAGQGFDHLLEEVIRTGRPYVAKEVQVELRRNNKLETLYVDLTYQPKRRPDNIIDGVLVVASDVTQQVKARQLIEESERRFRYLIEQAPIGTCLYIDRNFVLK